MDREQIKVILIDAHARDRHVAGVGHLEGVIQRVTRVQPVTSVSQNTILHNSQMWIINDADSSASRDGISLIRISRHRIVDITVTIGNAVGIYAVVVNIGLLHRVGAAVVPGLAHIQDIVCIRVPCVIAAV